MPRDLKPYRERLEALRQDLRDEIVQRAESVKQIAGRPEDDVDVHTHTADRDSEGLDVEIGTGAAQHAMLEAVEAALERIDEGTYGRCEDCGTEMASERLDAIPYAALCVDCQAKMDES